MTKLRSLEQVSGKKPNALIMAGGTGGHIFPGLAIAKELQTNGWNTFWLGSVGGMESQLVGDTNISLNLISVSGLRGNGIIGWLQAPYTLLKAIYQASKIIRRIKPDVVIGFGGFASGPGGLAAFLLRKPLFIHEQNAIAGLTNRTLAKIANRVFQAFPMAFGKKESCQTIGNPIRREIIDLNKENIEQTLSANLHLLVIGGSRGARSFNQILPEILAILITQYAVKVHHQCGCGNKKYTLDCYAKNNISHSNELVVDEFIDNMEDAYRWADIVVCRAGALTVAEVAAVGIAAIFIPFPFAVDDHQTKNALWLVEQQAGILIAEKDMLSNTSKEQFLKLVSNRQEINEMASKAKKLAYLNATRKMVNACESLVGDIA